LVRLHADQGNQAKIAIAAIPGDERRHIDASVGLVDGIDFDFDLGPQHLTRDAIGRNAVNGGKGIGRNHRAPPADDVAIVVVMRRLD
jgi:hypothetical protein